MKCKNCGGEITIQSKAFPGCCEDCDGNQIKDLIDRDGISDTWLLAHGIKPNTNSWILTFAILQNDLVMEFVREHIRGESE